MNYYNLPIKGRMSEQIEEIDWIFRFVGSDKFTIVTNLMSPSLTEHGIIRLQRREP